MNNQLKKVLSILLNLPILFMSNQGIYAVNPSEENLSLSKNETLKSENDSDMDYYIKLYDSIRNDDSDFVTKARKMVSFMQNKKYKIEKKLGSGYNGIVYLATSPSGENVALKFTYSIAHNIRATAINFLGDIDLYNELIKNKIDLGSGACKILDYEQDLDVNIEDIFVGIDDFNVCVILEFIEGQKINNYIKEHNYTYEDVVKWLKSICESLSKIHKLGYVYRGVSEYNIMIKEKDHSATLIDFGKAFSYKKHNINIKKDVDLSGIKELIEFLIVHSNYQKSNNDEKLTSLFELNTFDEFYRNLCNL